ncbi:DUF3048 domain-containing protein [Streptomyces sp. N35]|uniref:DUF3048 domain-containing protein n=1 Tax=Streptomyces sp. N35 TaxID=2795730 RepID=UPI0018F3F7ED|nr:DUF3048 domain-containing protein [Streptomyces sp. N35]
MSPLATGRRRRTVPLLALLAAGSLTLGAAPAADRHDPVPPQGAESTTLDEYSPLEAYQQVQGPWKISPYTGLMAKQGPVLAVKFDNARRARPHHNLDKADLVYVEKVEGGMSRLMGMYSSQIPKSLGPVRSARESDVELLKQFGRPALAYSGVRSALHKYLKNSPIYVRSHGSLPRAYFRAPGRSAPHNLFVNPAKILKSAPGAWKPTDIGFRFGPAPKGGTPMAQRTVRYASASHTFRWSPAKKRWYVSFDGAPARLSDGRQMSARTIVIQKVHMPPSKYRDVNGAVTPYIKTVGQGWATVLRDGKAYKSWWMRPNAKSGTKFIQKGGKPMPFAQGQVWVVYVDA